MQNLLGLPAYPLGSGSSCRVTFSGPRRLQDGPRGPQEAPKTFQEPSSRRTIGPRRPRRPQDGPRGLQDVPREPQDSSQEGPKRPKSLIYFRFLEVFGFLAFSSSRRSKTAQEPPKTTPRRFENPSSGLGASQALPEDPLGFPENLPEDPQGPPRTFPGPTKDLPRHRILVLTSAHPPIEPEHFRRN